MSLRKINRDMSGSRGVSNLFGIRKGSHFGKLKKHKGFSRTERSHKAPTKLSKDMLQVLVIAIVTIVVIAVIVFISSNKAAPEPVAPVNNTPQNNTPTNQTPLIVNQTPEIDLPDLDISAISFSSDTPTLGQELTITATVRNRGDVNATNVPVLFKIGVLELGRVTADNVSVDEEVEVSINWTIIEDAIGENKLEAIVDPDDDIEEESENNNNKDKTLEVSDQLIEDVSDEFEHKQTRDFIEHWYSDSRFPYMIEGSEEYEYFQLVSAQNGDDVYHLDVVIPGFKVTKINSVSGVEVPDASTSGYNTRRCIKETQSDETCIWNGPQITITLDFEGNKLVATDHSGNEKKVTNTDNRIKNIRMTAMRIADWPDEEIKTWRAYEAPQPNRLIPLEFYEVDDDTNKIYIHPMRWHPRDYNAKVLLWIRFEIET